MDFIISQSRYVIKGEYHQRMRGWALEGAHLDTWTHPLHHIIKMWLTMLTVCSENQDVVDKILEDYDISCIGKLNID